MLCLRQYRHPARRRFVELPAGLCDVDGEDPLEVARRELREEAGLEAGEWVELTSTYSSPGISSELMHFYLARDLAPIDRGDFVPEHEEADMETLWVDFEELLAAALDGRLRRRADRPGRAARRREGLRRTRTAQGSSLRPVTTRRGGGHTEGESSR